MSAESAERRLRSRTAKTRRERFDTTVAQAPFLSLLRRVNERCARSSIAPRLRQERAAIWSPETECRRGARCFRMKNHLHAPQRLHSFQNRFSNTELIEQHRRPGIEFRRTRNRNQQPNAPQANGNEAVLAAHSCHVSPDLSRSLFFGLERRASRLYVSQSWVAGRT